VEEARVMLVFAPVLYVSAGIIALCACLEQKNSEERVAKAVFVLLLFILIFIAGFRTIGVGNDDLAYAQIYEKIPQLAYCRDWICGYSYGEYAVEPGFYAILLFLKVFSSNPHFLFVMIAAVSITLNLYSIRKFSPYVAAAVLVYFTHFFLGKELNAVRVGLASSILFYAMRIGLDGKKLFSFLLFLLACTIHATSIFIVIPVVVLMCRFNRVAYVTIGVVAIIGSFFINPKTIFQFIANLGFFTQKIDIYINNETYGRSLRLIDAVNLKNIAILTACLLYWDKLTDWFRHFYVSFAFMFTATCFRVLMGPFAIVAGRGYSAISMFEYVLVPMLAVAVGGAKFGTIITIAYCAIILIMNTMYNTGWSGGATHFFFG
jgi:hypothetical protein